MPTKDFEHTIRFHQVTSNNGEIISIPIVTVDIIQDGGNRVTLPLIFDTGASVTTLRHDLYPVLGLSSWDVGELVETQTAGGPDPVKAYRYQANIGFLGKNIQCTIHLQILPQNPLFVGLFGRRDIFQEFGFGFWERSGELYINSNP